MTMEEALTVIQKIADAWNAFGQAMENAAQALQDMFRGLAESDELWPKRNGVPPKKYGMSLHRRVRSSLHRRVRSSPPRYQFVPVAPRNQPYQRRAF